MKVHYHVLVRLHLRLTQNMLLLPRIQQTQLIRQILRLGRRRLHREEAEVCHGDARHVDDPTLGQCDLGEGGGGKNLAAGPAEYAMDDVEREEVDCGGRG
jgi:hypothetical protein